MSLYFLFWISGVWFSRFAFSRLHLCFTYARRHLPYFRLYHCLPYLIFDCLYWPFTSYGKWPGHPPLKWDEEKRWTFRSLNNEWIVVSQVNIWIVISTILFYPQSQTPFVTHSISYFPLSWTFAWILSSNTWIYPKNLNYQTVILITWDRWSVNILSKCFFITIIWNIRKLMIKTLG